ncbi:MAG: P-loop NTPase fold protein [Thermodesulfobacteriota bacterium]
MTEPEQFFSADRPGKNPETDDRLGYAPFADRLASAICGMSTPEGIVAAICGEWGTGKSTLIEFVRYYLARREERERPDIVYFNPWWFSGTEQLVSAFFYELLATAAPNKLTKRKNLKRIATFVRLISHVPIPGFKVAEEFAGIIASEGNIVQLRQEVTEILVQARKHILVIMDDIDRLPPSDIQDLFRLIKAVGNFPNVIYLIAFDRAVVANALSESGVQGEDYLEKIAQLVVDLPKLDRAALDSMFMQELNDLIKDLTLPEFDLDYFHEVYNAGVRDLLNTPRNIARLINAMKFTYRPVAREVSLADFVALESLRLFRPEVYRWIKANTAILAGGTPSEFESTVIKSILKGFIEKPNGPVDALAQSLLRKIFPRFELMFSTAIPDRPSAWRKALRACSVDKIELYFSFGLPEGELSRLELDGLVNAARDPVPQSLGEILKRLTEQRRRGGVTRASQALEQLADLAEYASIDAKIVPNMVHGLLYAGDAILSNADRGLPYGFVENRHRFVRLLTLLLRALSLKERSELLRTAVQTAPSLAATSQLVAALGDEHGKYSGEALPEDKRLVSAGTLLELESITGNRIAAASDEGSLQSVPDLDHVLFRWSDWRSKKEVSEWLTKDLENILAFLRWLIPDEKIQDRDDPIADLSGRRYRQVALELIGEEDVSRLVENFEMETLQSHSRNDAIRLKLLFGFGVPKDTLDQGPDHRPP